MSDQERKLDVTQADPQGDGAPAVKFDIPEMHMWFVGTVTIASDGDIIQADGSLIGSLAGPIS
jgi:hypothetical protein